MKTIIAPINAILVHENKLIVAQGQCVTINDKTLNFVRSIKGFKLLNNLLVVYGNKIFALIDTIVWKCTHKITINSIICDVIFENELFWCLTMRGEVSRIRLQNNELQLINTYTSANSITAGKFLLTDYIGGMWDGNVVYLSKKYKIHDGTVYDIGFNDKYIISSSTDRSICVYDFAFNIVHRVYDFRTRIFKCGFITNNTIIQKFVNWHNEKVKITNKISHSHLFYYGITEHGKIMVFSNQDCIYEYTNNSAKIMCLAETTNNLIVGFDNGTIEKLQLNSITTIIGEETQLILPFICSNNKYKAIPSIQETIQKIKMINNVLYAAIKSDLYIYHEQKLIFVQTFSSHIIEIYENVILTLDKTIVTKDNHKTILFSYPFKNITTATKEFIGTRKGVLIYKDIAVKISNDAISGIMIHGNDLYMTCNDGYLYLLKDVTYLTKQTNCINMHNESSLQYNIITYPIYKKYISSNFLQGLFYNGVIHTYAFSKHNLTVHSNHGSYTYKIGTKPSHYYFCNNYFYYLEHGVLYKLKLNVKNNFDLQGNFTNISKFKNKYFYVTNNSIIYTHENVHDTLYVEDVSCICVRDDLCFVGTLEGFIKVINFENNQLWIAAEYKNEHRIMDLAICQDENVTNIYFIDSYGMLVILVYKSHALQEKVRKSFDILFTTIAIDGDKILIGTAEGSLLILTKNLSVILENKIHHCAINKLISFRLHNENIIATGADDHQLNIYQASKDISTAITMSSKVLDILYIPNKNMLVCLTADRYVTIVDVSCYKVIKKLKHAVYGACSMIYDGHIVVVGNGMDRLEIE